jgi:hypothetical protein
MFTPFLAALVMAPQHSRGHGHMRHSAKAQKPFNEEPGIRAGYADVTRAFETKNWSLFRSRLAPNFQQELPNHHVLSAKQTMSGIRQQFGPLSEIKAKFDVQQIKVNGSTAVCEARIVTTAKMKDKKGGHTVRMEGSETDSLKKIGGRWVAYFVKVHDQSESVDGHVVMHMP